MARRQVDTKLILNNFFGFRNMRDVHCRHCTLIHVRSDSSVEVFCGRNIFNKLNSFV